MYICVCIYVYVYIYIYSHRAERIASERCEDVGKSIGYNVRLDACVSSKSQMIFVTPGKDFCLYGDIAIVIIN